MFTFVDTTSVSKFNADDKGVVWLRVADVKAGSRTKSGSGPSGTPSSGVTLSRKRDDEQTGLSLPQLLHLQSATAALLARRAATLEAGAFAVLWRGHDEDQIVDPDCDVRRVPLRRPGS